MICIDIDTNVILVKASHGLVVVDDESVDKLACVWIIHATSVGLAHRSPEAHRYYFEMGAQRQKC